MAADLAAAVDRVPRLIAILGLLGAVAAWPIGGIGYAIAFMTGAIGAYFNFRLIERFVKQLVQSMIADPVKRPKTQALKLVMQLALFVLGAFVIIRFTHIHLAAAFLGLFTPVAAVMVEILYELGSRK